MIALRFGWETARTETSLAIKDSWLTVEVFILRVLLQVLAGDLRFRFVVSFG
jgi:hypothetical protein